MEWSPQCTLSTSTQKFLLRFWLRETPRIRAMSRILLNFVRTLWVISTPYKIRNVLYLYITELYRVCTAVQHIYVPFDSHTELLIIVIFAVSTCKIKMCTRICWNFQTPWFFVLNSEFFFDKKKTTQLSVSIGLAQSIHAHRTTTNLTNNTKHAKIIAKHEMLAICCENVKKNTKDVIKRYRIGNGLLKRLEDCPQDTTYHMQMATALMAANQWTIEIRPAPAWDATRISSTHKIIEGTIRRFVYLAIFNSASAIVQRVRFADEIISVRLHVCTVIIHSLIFSIDICFFFYAFCIAIVVGTVIDSGSGGGTTIQFSHADEETTDGHANVTAPYRRFVWERRWEPTIDVAITTGYTNA